jgi:hypothetical protein
LEQGGRILHELADPIESCSRQRLSKAILEAQDFCYNALALFAKTLCSTERVARSNGKKSGMQLGSLHQTANAACNGCPLIAVVHDLITPAKRSQTLGGTIYPVKQRRVRRCRPG